MSTPLEPTGLIQDRELLRMEPATWEKMMEEHCTLKITAITLEIMIMEAETMRILIPVHLAIWDLRNLFLLIMDLDNMVLQVQHIMERSSAGE